MSGLPLYFGFGLIAVTVAGGFWLFSKQRFKTTNIVMFSAVFGTLGFACAYLPYLETIQVGPLKLTMWQRAQQLLSLERRTKDLDDNLSAKQKELATLVERSEKLAADNKKSEETILRLKQQQELYVLFVRAMHGLGEREAFDKLEKLSTDKTYLESETAQSYWKQIMDTHASNTIQSLAGTPWFNSVSTKNLQELEVGYQSTSDVDGIFIRHAIIEVVKTKVHASKKEKLAFLAKILETEKTMEHSEHAGRAFDEIAGTGFHPLARKDILDWWKKNSDTLE